MLSRLVLSLLLLLPALSWAQGPSAALVEDAKGRLKRVTVAQLATANRDKMYRVTDGSSVSDCTGGGGTDEVICYWSGAAWTAATGTGGGGTGTVTNTGTLTANQVVIGNAGVDVKVVGALGTDGQCLTSQGAGLPPQWENCAAAGLDPLASGFLSIDGASHAVSSRTLTGTSNEINITNTTGGGNPVFSLSDTVDLGGKTSFEIPNAAAPTTDAFGEIAGDNNAWAASRGAVQFYDGTANTYLVGALASDTPSNGQVPTWNTGGTVTWETPSTSSGITLLCKGAPAQATTGTTEEVLATCSMSAGLLTTGGHAIRVTFFGHTAANANNKTYSVRVGGISGTVVYTSGSMAANDSNIATTNPIVVTYLSATTATAAGELGRQAAAGTAWTTIGKSERSASITWANALDVVITATTATTAGDATLDTYQVELLK